MRKSESDAKVAKWRVDHGLGQIELADLLGVNPITLSRWERDVATPPKFLYLALVELERRLAVGASKTQKK